MAIADNRQRFMPLPDDRLPGRGEVLAYPEAVQLVDPIEPEFKGEVYFRLFTSMISISILYNCLKVQKKIKKKKKPYSEGQVHFYFDIVTMTQGLDL